MTAISKGELWKQFKSGDLDPVYLFYGIERFQRDVAVDKLAESALTDPGFREFNENIIDVRDQGLENVFASCEQLPFGGGKRVVIARDFYISSNRMNNSVREADLDQFEKYLLNPSKDTVLVFVAEELDKRLRASKLLIKNSSSVEFGMLRPEDAKKWARDRFKQEGVSADENVISTLVGLTGEDAGRLAIEAKKLAAASEPEKVVTAELVKALVSHSKELSNFDLTNQLLAGKSQAAIRTMLKLIEDGVEPLALLGMLGYSFRQLVFAKEMMERGFDRPSILKRMGFRGNPNSMFGAARKADARRLTRNLVRISEADLKIKTSVGDPRTQIEMLICELAVS